MDEGCQARRMVGEGCFSSAESMTRVAHSTNVSACSPLLVYVSAVGSSCPFARSSLVTVQTKHESAEKETRNVLQRCLVGIFHRADETYKTQPSHFPMLLLESASTNHAPLTPLQRSVPRSHIRLSRNIPTSSASSCDSCAMDAMPKVPCGRCAIKTEGDMNVNRSVCLSSPQPESARAQGQPMIVHVPVIYSYPGLPTYRLRPRLRDQFKELLSTPCHGLEVYFRGYPCAVERTHDTFNLRADAAAESLVLEQVDDRQEDGRWLEDDGLGRSPDGTGALNPFISHVGVNTEQEDPQSGGNEVACCCHGTR